MSNDDLYLAYPQDRNEIKNDYSFTECLFELEIEEGALYLRTHSINNKMFNRRRIRTNIDDLSRNYIRLQDFLNNSEYIGKVTHRAKATTQGDKSFMNTDGYNIMLYKGERHIILLQLKRDGRERIDILDDNYVDDNWTYIGESLGLYSDKEEMLSKLRSLIIREDTPIRK